MSEHPLPAQPKLLLFSLAVAGLRRLLPASVRSLLGTLLFGVTPSVPASLLTLGARSSPIRAGGIGGLLTFCFCFIGTCVVTLVSGTFRGTDTTRHYFIHDWMNLINYSFLCPAYVACGVAFIFFVRQAWRDLETNSVLAPPVPLRLPRLSAGMAVFIVLFVASALTVNYIRECMSPSVYSFNAWYFDQTLASGERGLGLAGTYYVLTNYTLLLVCCITAFTIFPYSIVAAEVSRGIQSRDLTKAAVFEPLQAALANFTCAYIAVKLFVACLMLNLETWKWAQPHSSTNFYLARLVLSTVGLLVVSFPRYYIELEWYRFRVRAANAAGEIVPAQPDDLRDWRIGMIAFALDLFFGATFVVTLWYRT